MKFSAFITIISKLYDLSKTFGLQNTFNIESMFDNHPDILARLQTYAQNKIAINATNGKKTIANFFNQILEANNQTYITNITKDAQKIPFFSAIALSLKKDKKYSSKTNDFYKRDYFSIILDEEEIQNYFINTKFDTMLLHNLFIDQKDFSTLIEKRKKIQNAIILNSKLNLVINADEPMFYEIDSIKNDSAQLKKRRKFFYGFESIEFADGKQDLNQKNDIQICPKCACPLDYSKLFYSHLGQYRCGCGFKRPRPDISASAKIFADYSLLTVYYKDNKNVFKVPMGGIYNAYNALGAIALAYFLNIERKIVTQAFDNYKPLKARDEIIRYKDKNIKIKIIKNPTSLTESIREISNGKTRLVLCLNDAKEDGFDTSWIFDSNPNSLKGFENKIYVTSPRLDDMALWLKYGGINPCLIVMDTSIKTTIECCYYEVEENEKMLILATPSQIGEIYKVLDK